MVKIKAARIPSNKKCNCCKKQKKYIVGICRDCFLSLGNRKRDYNLRDTL